MQRLLILTVLGSLVAAAASAQAAAPKFNEQEQISLLQSADTPKQEKALACKRLAVVGTYKAVPAVAPLLVDEQLSSWARITLEAIPDSAANDALRKAVGELKGKLLVGVINSIGVRRDANAVETIAPRLKDADAEVASATAVALGRIGTAPAVKALEGALAGAPAAVRGAVGLGCIFAAERQLADGKKDEAVRIYELVRKADISKQRTLEATRGLIVAQKTAGLPLLVEQLRAQDKAAFSLALAAARELAGPEVTQTLLAELQKLAPERQALVLIALADRGDAAALPALLEGAKEAPGVARLAAIRALKKLGNATCVPRLLEAAVDADEKVSAAARDVLGELPGADVDAALLTALEKATGKSRLALIYISGERLMKAAKPALVKAADDKDAEVRAAALLALGNTIEQADLSLLIARVIEPRQADDAKPAGDALRIACTRMPDREACAAQLVAAAAKLPVATRITFLETLTAMGGETALKAVGAAVKDANPEIQDNASRLLGEWTTADAAPVLMDLAKTSTDGKIKVRALRGFLRIPRQLDLPPAQKLAMCQEALAVAQRPDEKKLVLDVLRRVANAEALTMATGMLSEPKLKADAAAAAVAISEKLVNNRKPAVAAAMQKVIDAGVDGDTAAKAKALLQQASPKGK